MKKGFQLHPGLLEWSGFRNARKDLRYLLLQSPQTLSDAFQLRQPSPFRSRAQFTGHLVLGLAAQGLTEQPGVGQHAFAFGAVGLLVMLVPGV